MIYPPHFEEKIGFDQVRQLVSAHCLSPLGQERVDQMTFSSRYAEVVERLEQTAEMLALLQGDSPLPASHYYDLRPALQRVRMEGTWLDQGEWHDLRRSLQTIRDLVTLLTKVDEAADTVPWPRLRHLAQDVDTFPQVISAIGQIISPYGEVRDNASPQLADLRHQLATTRGSISRLLVGILRAAQAEGLVGRDVSPTLRDGRLVIPVAPSLKRRIGGIVHDESASGKTIFIEPAEVVEANNRVRELESQERREVVRILTELTARLRPLIPAMLLSFEFLADIDFIRAKAALARDMQAVLPQVDDACLIDWHLAVHPLLRISLQKHDRQPVPLTIAMHSQQRILIISGPNAGGKSVCLKTVGLLQYMLQCGLLLPAAPGSRAGLFTSLFIDMGDEQSIDDELSTYSSHLTHMKQFLRHADPRSLILIDEFGGGTEPRIGGAIAEAVLRRLHERQAYAVITTHYHNLKQFADDHEGVANAAMLYDRHLLQPLFQLQIGQPGSSFAIEIARQIGLPEEVIADASQIVGSEYINADRYLLDIVRDKRYWENKRQQIHQQERQLQATIERYQAEADELHSQRRDILRQAQEQAEQLLTESNARIERTIRTIKEAQAERERTRQARAELQAWRTQLAQDTQQTDATDPIAQRMERLRQRQQRRQQRRKKGATAGPPSSAAPAGNLDTTSLEGQDSVPTSPDALSPSGSTSLGTEGTASSCAWHEGDAVRLKGQPTVGRVLSVSADGRQVVVAFGHIKTTLAANRLQAATAVRPSTELSTRSTTVSLQTQDSIHQKSLHFSQELDVRGMRGTEALQAVTYYLDDAILLGASRIRILHGTGNGILRSLIRQYLATVPNVKDYHDEHVQLGGAGITVVEL